MGKDSGVRLGCVCFFLGGGEALCVRVHVVVLGGDGLVSVLALEVPGGAVVSVVCGGRGSLSYELQLWGGRIGFGHVRGSSGCLCIFFCPHLCYVCDDGVGGGCTLVLLFASCCGGCVCTGLMRWFLLGPSACDADARVLKVGHVLNGVFLLHVWHAVVRMCRFWVRWGRGLCAFWGWVLPCVLCRVCVLPSVWDRACVEGL